MDTAEQQVFVDRSEKAARSAIKRAAGEVLAHADDDLAQGVVDDSLVDEVFRLAWRYQFSEGRVAVRAELQQVVGDRVAEVLLAAEEDAK